MRTRLGIMPTDLYKIYKQIRQRATRNPHDFKKSEMHRLAKELVKNTHSIEEKIALAEKIYELERRTPGCQKLYSRIILRALKANDFTVDVPYPVRHSWEEQQGSTGYIYIATAPSKPGQSKIGSTKTPIAKRLALYILRYGYYVSVHWRKKVQMPYTLEERIKKEIISYRVSGLTDGDSNEWYQLSPEQLREKVEIIIDNISNEKYSTPR